MEIGILVAAAVAVAAIAAYYYVTNVKTSAKGAGDTANKTIIKINKTVYSEVEGLNDTSTGW
ncbi:hypothetical protein Metig_1463 [Methanotorris igneus Kol 5]|uniref:Class III signal peptide-containing protein n=2 Tax=Methanotorris igneus TaxID=2189 RepID=F6BAI5_METIK|nr:hypothetical protein Metig_1463 [Methanotorris igneus Kol 5]